MMYKERNLLERAPTPLRLGFEVEKEIPPSLRELADSIIACYQRHHPDLTSLYVVGSVAVGEWTEGISDIDVIGVVKGTTNTEANAARQNELFELGKRWPQVSFIDNSLISEEAFHAKESDPIVIGRVQIMAVSGLHIWGEALDLRDHFPSVEEMAYGRATRAKMLMEKYRAGNINESFRNDPRLLTRSCAKAALRVFSSITILRGAVFYTSPRKTYEMILEYAQEVAPLAQKALAIIDGAECEPSDAIDVTERAIDWFYDCYPNNQSARILV